MNKKIRGKARTANDERFHVEADGTMRIRKFKAENWRDYAGIAEGIVKKHLADKKKE